MTDGFADVATPILGAMLDLRRRLAAGEPRTLDDVMRQVQSWIEEATRRAGVDPDVARSFDDARYGLVAWIDELLTDSDWGHSVRWGSEEHVLEWLTFGSRDRGWRFYEYAEDAEARGSIDALEVYLLAVSLGFRGELARDPDRLTDWVERTYARVPEAGAAVESKPFPDDDDQAGGLTPPRGPSLLLRAGVMAAATMLATLAAYLLSVHHDYYSAG